MNERDKWIYELGQRHPNVLFEVSEAYIERRGKDKSEEECYVCDVCDGSWQGVNEQNGEFKCYHCTAQAERCEWVSQGLSNADYITHCNSVEIFDHDFKFCPFCARQINFVLREAAE